MNNKRYLLFAYNDCYPSDILPSVKRTFETLIELLEYAKADENILRFDYVELYDRSTGEFISDDELTAIAGQFDNEIFWIRKSLRNAKNLLNH